jgi:inward rectifier potassium channel
MSDLKSSKHTISDPGFGEKSSGSTKRLINKDGSFNVMRRHTGVINSNVYQFLLQIPFALFFLLGLGGFIVLSGLFGLVYYMIGPSSLSGVADHQPLHSFLDCFYFSTQTFTTVGYGAIAPQNALASSIAAFEAFCGLLFFAITTGLLYSRFSKPKAKFIYSKQAIITPFETGQALMFRFANMRKNTLMEMSARVILVMRPETKDQTIRSYFNLDLHLDKVVFLPLSWTLVHPITQESPLYGLTQQELIQRGAEILILISGFDDTFNQTIHSRFSYTADEIVWNAKFVRAFQSDEQGNVIMDMDDIHLHVPIQS